MKLHDLGIGLAALPGVAPVQHAVVHAAQWSTAATAVREGGNRLVALWGGDRRESARGFVAHAAFALDDGLAWLELPLDPAQPRYPDLARGFPCAGRMQRAMYDLLGIAAEGAVDTRPWIQHGAWPADDFPLRRDARPSAVGNHPVQAYPFVRVEGDGVHEIAVGPIHAGTIEPGNFRFSMVGEKVLRIEERLGYAHRGVEKRFEQVGLARGHALAARVSGDSAVAFAWAYCMACESAHDCTIPPRAAWLRALLLERERVANHLGDLGAIANDAGLAFGLAQLSPLREDSLRLHAECFGHRLLMDTLVPGGVAVDVDARAQALLLAQADAIEGGVRALQAILDEHAGLQDRLLGTGRVTPALAARLGLVGLAGRASGQALDLRVRQPAFPYDRLGVVIAGSREGDVAARVGVRLQELHESLRLIRELVRGLPDGPVAVALPDPAERAAGIGWVEGWRGEVLVALETGPSASILRCHCHDPSWQNWPVIEHAAVDGNIVADFPLINKSFNLNYAGHDL